MSSAYVMGSFFAQVLSLSSLLAFFFGFFIKSRSAVNILCIISSIIEVSFIASLSTNGLGGHAYIFSIIISLIIGNLVFASRKSSTKSTKKSKRSQNIKVESFVSVSFSSIENFAVNNSKNENALVALLIYFVANKKLEKKLIDYPMQFNEKMKFDLCDHLFKEFNIITDELIKIKEDCLDKDEKEKILEFKYALDEALMFIYGFLTMKKQLEINLIIRSWKILCNNKQYIPLELEIKKLPSFFDEMIDSFDDIKDKTNQFDPYFISDQYEIDLKKQKKEDFQKLKNNALDGVANTLEGIGSLVKKTRSSKTTNNNIGLEDKLNKLNELKNNKTITESEYQQMRVQILNKFTGSDTEKVLSVDENILKETIEEIDTSTKENINIYDEEGNINEKFIVNPTDEDDKVLMQILKKLTAERNFGFISAPFKMKSTEEMDKEIDDDEDLSIYSNEFDNETALNIYPFKKHYLLIPIPEGESLDLRKKLKEYIVDDKSVLDNKEFQMDITAIKIRTDSIQWIASITIFINTSSVSPSSILLGYIKSKSIKGIWEKFEDFIDNKNNITLS